MDADNLSMGPHRWTASELRKLPEAERDSIVEAAAALLSEQGFQFVKLDQTGTEAMSSKPQPINQPASHLDVGIARGQPPIRDARIADAKIIMYELSENLARRFDTVSFWGVAAILFFCMFSCSAILLYLIPEDWQKQSFIGLPGAAGIALLAATFAARRVMRRRDKEFNVKLAKLPHCTYAITFSHGYLDVETAFSFSRMPWESLESIECRKDRWKLNFVTLPVNIPIEAIDSEAKEYLKTIARRFGIRFPRKKRNSAQLESISSDDV